MYGDQKMKPPIADWSLRVEPTRSRGAYESPPTRRDESQLGVGGEASPCTKAHIRLLGRYESCAANSKLREYDAKTREGPQTRKEFGQLG